MHRVSIRLAHTRVAIHFSYGRYRRAGDWRKCKWPLSKLMISDIFGAISRDRYSASLRRRMVTLAWLTYIGLKRAKEITLMQASFGIIEVKPVRR